MPDTSPDDAASLTALLYHYGTLWQITKTPHGYRAQCRPAPCPPVVFTAPTMPALRQLLHHGYDTGKLADLLRDFAAGWDIEDLDPGSAWVAISRDNPAQVIAAADLDYLRTSLGRAPERPPAR